MRSPSARLASLLAACAALCAACGGGASDAPNVLLVTIDTLRADRVGCYGYARNTTPRLDALAAEGVRFARAYSHAPFTAPAHASLLTSLHTPSHGVYAWAERLADDARPMGERFTHAGYRTAAIYNQPALKTSDVTRGFQHVRQLFLEDRDVTARLFFEWLDAGDGPFAAWVHLWDVHRPYGYRDWRAELWRDKVQPREEYTLAYAEERFGAATDVRVGRREGHYNLHPEEREQASVGAGGDARPLGAADWDYIGDRYDGGVWYADRGLGLLLDGLKERGLYDDTLIVVTSDHGESLDEREPCWFTHDPFLYEETLRVPLVIRFPGGEHGGRTVDALARGVDVLPTMLAVADLPLVGGEQGRSLLGSVLGTDGARHTIFAQTQTKNAKESDAHAAEGAWLEHRVMIGDGRHKLIHDVSTDTWEYYDLQTDPGEERNRFEDPFAKARVDELREALVTLQNDLPRAGDTSAKLDPQALDVLRGTGYVGEGGE